MSKLWVRLVAALIIPCMLTDPSWSAPRKEPSFRTVSSQIPFETYALMPRIAAATLLGTAAVYNAQAFVAYFQEAVAYLARHPYAALSASALLPVLASAFQPPAPQDEPVTLIQKELAVDRSQSREGQEQISAFMAEAWNQLNVILLSYTALPEDRVARELITIGRAFDRALFGEGKSELAYSVRWTPGYIVIQTEVNGGTTVAGFSATKSLDEVRPPASTGKDDDSIRIPRSLNSAA